MALPLCRHATASLPAARPFWTGLRHIVSRRRLSPGNAGSPPCPGSLQHCIFQFELIRSIIRILQCHVMSRDQPVLFQGRRSLDLGGVQTVGKREKYLAPVLFAGNGNCMYSVVSADILQPGCRVRLISGWPPPWGAGPCSPYLTMFTR